MLGVSVATVYSMRADGMPVAASWKRSGCNRKETILFREIDVKAWIARKPKAEVEAPEIPEMGEDGVAAGVDSFGVVVAGVLFALMAAGIIFGAVMAIIG